MSALAVAGWVALGAAMGAVCGLLIWREQAGAPKAKGMLLGAVLLLAGGAAMVFLGA